jgi:glycerol kinase
MANYIAAIDQGTTSTRCLIFNHSGNIIALDQKEHQQIFPKPGWVEHNPLEILKNAIDVANSALEKAGLKPADISAIGITNQRETTVVWNRFTGKPYYNAIVWQDTRTDSICNELASHGGQDRFREKVGLPLATYFSGPKISWILQNIPGVQSAAEQGDAIFGNIDSWLIWNLTGGQERGNHVTDVTNASRTLLMDLHALSWDNEIVQMLGIPISMLPQIKSSSEIYGYTKTLWPGVPICGNLGDQQAALFGQACYASGEAKNTYGTGCFTLMNTGENIIASKHGLLTTVGYKIGDSPAIFSLEGSIAITGALVQWLRDNLHIIEKTSDIEALANTVPDNGGIYFVPAFSGLFAPYWRSDARGAILGMTRFVNRGHVARAVLEATAYQTREVLEAMKEDSGVNVTSLKVDGGMVFNELLMQFQADILNVPVIRPRISETTALGAAYAAGLAVGYWKNFAELQGNWGKDKGWQPNMKTEVRDKLFSTWRKAVTRTFDWVE